MAALADFDDYRKRLDAPRELIFSHKAAVTLVCNRLNDLWTATPFNGTAPTTAVVPTNATAGSFLQTDADSEELYIPGLQAGAGSLSAGTYILCDRLSHQGGLDGTVVTANLTTNLPTAALTRYTSGTGVMIGLTVYTQIGATITSISCGYTNDAGGASVSPQVVVGNTGLREALRFFPIPLATGDTGARAVNNSTLALSTGTAGAFGYMLYKPLMSFTIDKTAAVVTFSLLDGGMQGGLPPILDGACLFWLAMPQGVATTISSGISSLVTLTAV